MHQTPESCCEALTKHQRAACKPAECCRAQHIVHVCRLPACLCLSGSTMRTCAGRATRLHCLQSRGASTCTSSPQKRCAWAPLQRSGLLQASRPTTSLTTLLQHHCISPQARSLWRAEPMTCPRTHASFSGSLPFEPRIRPLLLIVSVLMPE